MTRLIAGGCIAILATTGVWAVVALAYQQKRDDAYQAWASFLVAAITLGGASLVLAVLATYP